MALLWADGPSTAYAIRRNFQRSPTPDWSGSAGAIYPLLARLDRGRLVRSQAYRTGRRPGRRFQLTLAGKRALRRWLEPPLTDEVVGIPSDPLRTRLGFLDALPPRLRAAFLAEAHAKMQALLPVLQAECTRLSGKPYRQLMAQGGLTMLKARLRWIRTVTPLGWAVHKRQLKSVGHSLQAGPRKSHAARSR